MRWWLLVVGICVPLIAESQTFHSREDQFIFVDRTPTIVGALKEQFSRHDPEHDLSYAKEVYQAETDTHFIVTHISKVACGTASLTNPKSSYLMAIQYLPRVPKSFLDATRHDYFKEVYVMDENERVRLYEDVTGHQMLELTERFRPVCVSL